MTEKLFFLCIALFVILILVIRYYNRAMDHIVDSKEYMQRTKNAADAYYNEKVAETKEYMQRTKNAADAYYNEKVVETKEYMQRTKNAADAYYNEKVVEINEKMAATSEKEQAATRKETFVNNFLSAKINDLPILAKVISDYDAARENYISELLAQKRPPPLNAIKERSRIAKEKEFYIRSLKATEWKLIYLHQLLSWLPELSEPVGNASDNYAKICIAAETYKKEQIDLGNTYYHEKKLAGDTYYKEKKTAADHYCERINDEIVTALQANDEEIRAAKLYKENIDKEVLQIKRNAEKLLGDAQHKKALIEDQIKEKEAFSEQFLATKIKEFPTLAQVIADYDAVRYGPIIDSLVYRSPSAYKSAEIVKELREERRTLIAQNKAYEWELAYIRQLLPWLSDLEEEPIEPQNTYYNTEYNKQDAAGFWLTPEEYKQLSPIERNQRALDRYKKRHKTNAEIGRDYERYIGYLYEEKGYTVTYYGIERGLEDFGRDLICQKDNETLVIQCKCWSNKKKKIIREKHINQLYGTYIAYKIAKATGLNLEDVGDISEDQLYRLGQVNLDIFDTKAVFCSTVPFSPAAEAFAKLLNIDCLVKPLGEYPMIKCNINGKNGERIYHLPFDQQYDKCVITPSEGECYALMH
ncbi:hypothetical protein TAMA11512_21800 [Selenomonas sp. TAMA-11512]|uniref:restriction endonuclease n=1 Tax=Selenomonas sp. TAMA-11512 TaxID=3095337 RepID=UPI0030886637|nr:hypothetical protein TAMA11512_21800 [Selenomonas sp. TAMA-11512]